MALFYSLFLLPRWLPFTCDLPLVAARLRHISGTRWGTKKYLNMKRLEEMKDAVPEDLGSEASA